MKKTYFLCTFLAFCSTTPIYCSVSEEAYPILEVCFPETAREKISVESLNGGLSGTGLYKVEVNGKWYVLRVHRSKYLSKQDEREHFAIIEAAKKGIAPGVVYVSPDNLAIIMEHIPGKTLSIEQAGKHESVAALAKAIRSAHEIIGHPAEGETLLSKADRCTDKVLKDGLAPASEILDALNLIKKYRQDLSLYDFAPVNVHGDLNPRNIFITSRGVLLIDWAETTLEDPFYDLSYLALKADYGPKEEYVLLKAYLQRPPMDNELNRYALQKKIHQAFWSLTNLYLADMQLRKNPEQKIDAQASLKEWGYYQKKFADPSEELSAQYFYELSRLNYQLAR